MHSCIIFRRTIFAYDENFGHIDDNAWGWKAGQIRTMNAYAWNKVVIFRPFFTWYLAIVTVFDTINYSTYLPRMNPLVIHYVFYFITQSIWVKVMLSYYYTSNKVQCARAHTQIHTYVHTLHIWIISSSYNPGRTDYVDLCACRISNIVGPRTPTARFNSKMLTIAIIGFPLTVCVLLAPVILFFFSSGCVWRLCIPITFLRLYSVDSGVCAECHKYFVCFFVLLHSIAFDMAKFTVHWVQLVCRIEFSISLSAHEWYLEVCWSDVFISVVRPSWAERTCFFESWHMCHPETKLLFIISEDCLMFKWDRACTLTMFGVCSGCIWSKIGWF